MESIGYAIVCKGDFDREATGGEPTAVPLIATHQLAEEELARIVGTPGGTMRCFEDHIIINVYGRSE